MSNVAETILAQLGGARRLAAMTGASNFLDHGDGLSFKFKGSKKVNYVKITLRPSDTYDVEFGKIRGYDYKKSRDYSDIYADQLMGLFEKETGLYLTL